ncbi:MAG: glycosyltransferase family 1 protein [Nitrospiraceae bacterium]|nr:MAG: glycosyltransferase family 1 protein [Nitrospiraceae bacterium]
MDKILFVTNVVYGGARQYYIDLITGVKNNGRRTEAYIVSRPGEKGLEGLCRELEQAAVRYTVRQPLEGNYNQIIRQRCTDIRLCNPDIIHFNQGGPACTRLEMAAARRLQIPFVATSHLPTIKSGKTRNGFPKTPLSLREWCYPWEADAYIVESDRNKEMMTVNQGIPEDKIHVIHYGLDFGKFKREERNHEVLSPYGIAPEHFVIGSIGDLNWRKAQHVLIAAAAEILKKGLFGNIRFIIFGAGEKETELKDLIDRLGIGDCFKLAGRIDRSLVPEVLSRFDIFCMSSDIEGQPYAMLEALLAGLPVVSTAVDGVVDILKNGKNGLLVPKGDHAALASALTELIEDDGLRGKIASNAESSIDQRYRMSAMIERTEKVYQEVRAGAAIKKGRKGLRFRRVTGNIIDVLLPVLGPVEKYILLPASRFKNYLSGGGALGHASTK